MKSLTATIAIAAAALALAPAAVAQSAPAETSVGEEASIPFVNFGSIRNWRAVDRDTLYVEDRSGNWYRAALFGPCSDLPFAETIGFDAGGTGRLDKFSAVVVRGQRCAFSSFVTSGPPPSRKDREQAKPQKDGKSA